MGTVNRLWWSGERGDQGPRPLGGRRGAAEETGSWQRWEEGPAPVLPRASSRLPLTQRPPAWVLLLLFPASGGNVPSPSVPTTAPGGMGWAGNLGSPRSLLFPLCWEFLIFWAQGRGLVSTDLLWSRADTDTCASLGSEATLLRASVSPQCPHSVPTCPRAGGPGPAHPCSTGSWVTAQEPELTHFPFLGPAQATPPLPGSADERGSPRVPTWVSSSPSLRAQPWVEEEKAQHPLPPPWNVFRPG